MLSPGQRTQSLPLFKEPTFIENHAVHNHNPGKPAPRSAALSSPPENPDAVDKELQSRLARIEQLLSSDPSSAEMQAGELLETTPGHPMAMLFQGIARRLTGNPLGAAEMLRPLCEQWPDAPLAHLQLGLALRETGQREAGARAMRRAVEIKPDFSDAWLALADLLIQLGERREADQAFAVYIRYGMQEPRLREPADLLRENRIADAEVRLREQLQRHPNDVAAMCLLADAAVRQARFSAAEDILTACLDLAPGYRAARHNYAVVLLREGKAAAALDEVDRLLADEPANNAVLNLKAAILIRLADYAPAIEVYRAILQDNPQQPGVWASLGHTLRTVGRLDDCVEAYRKAVEYAPHYGEAYWNLANLKTYRMTDEELDAMQAQIAMPGIRIEDRVHLHFAIGKAAEDRGSYADAFRHYTDGNRLRLKQIPQGADDIGTHVKRSTELFTRQFFEARTEYGTDETAPIFIVGLPRAGSTLVEQILASHSAVEGTMELPHVMGIAKSLVERADRAEAGYPDLLASLSADEFRKLGENYLERTESQRSQGVPHFIDKMPNNFMHLGLMQLMLPKCRIVDVRRHPMACGWSLFRHHFAHGQYFSYSLESIGRYYRNYVDLMAHFDAVLPGRVHRVLYEALVDDTETEVRRLLKYCDLPFEESCLAFYKNPRAVSTPSSEQVRLPIFRSGLDHWRRFEPWLEPLKTELAGVMDAWTDQP